MPTIIIMLIEILGAQSHHEDKVKLSTGGYITPIPNVVTYTASVPLLYRYTFPSIPEWVRVKSNPSRGEDRQVNSIYESILNVSDQLSNYIQDLDRSFIPIEKGKMTKTKRALAFVGGFLSWCCDVVTKSEIQPIISSEESLHTYVSNFHKQFSQEHEALANISVKLNKFDHELETTITEVVERINNITHVLTGSADANRDAIRRNYEQFDRILHILTIGFEHQIHMVQSAIRMQIQASCKQQRIPSIVLKPETLLTDLNELGEMLKQENQTLAINQEDIYLYYKYVVADCLISPTAVAITVRIPIRGTGDNWKISELRFMPFAWRGSTCHIVHEPSLIATSGQKFSPISGTGLRLCNPGISPMCYIPRYISDAYAGASCARQIVTGSDIATLASVCEFSCKPGRIPTVLAVGTETYMVIHIVGAIRIQCRGKAEVTHEVNATIGAIEIVVPCPCEMSYNGTVIISKSFPCDYASQDVKQIVHILPVMWSSIATLDIPPMTTHTEVTFKNLSQCLNANWNVHKPKIETKVNPLRPIEDQWEGGVAGQMDSDSYYRYGMTVVNWAYYAITTIIIIRQPYLVGFGMARPVAAYTREQTILTASLSGVGIVIGLAIMAIYKICQRCRNRQDNTVTHIEKGGGAMERYIWGPGNQIYIIPAAPGIKRDDGISGAIGIV